MSCSFTEKQIEDVIAFHGHSCPGLAIGIRASELAIRELGDVDSSQMVAVAETDMCGVDAIQFLTDCTYGKGNFLHRDYGKMAFSFYDRRSGKGFRALLKPEARAGVGEKLEAVMEKGSDSATAEEYQQLVAELRKQLQEQFMTLALEDMFEISPLDVGMPRPAQVLKSIVCECCGESVMESRIRRFGGKFVCIPCFGTMEQKI